MNESLKITLFGGLAINYRGEPVHDLSTRKTQALLVYLACNRQEHPRDVLATLLWEDQPQGKALTSLRAALTSLRKRLGAVLITSRNSVGIHPETELWLDVQEFEKRLQLGETEAALTLVRGEFLEGFSLRDSSLFEDWGRQQREHYRRSYENSLHMLVTGCLESGLYPKAAAYSVQLLQANQLDERAHRDLMRSLAHNGERSAALAQYQECCQQLREKLGVEPETATITLYKQILDGSYTNHKGIEPGRPASSFSHLLHNLPVQLTSFIGREKEIAAVRGLLQSARLVTLTGSGGTGKTRLALQTGAGLVEKYADGVWLVELAPLSDPALVPAIAARSLGLRELAGPQAILLLQEYLSTRHLLLILDNCEHVIEACTRLATALLEACPQLSILVSSREVLGITGEVLFRVPPMTLPGTGASPSWEALGRSEALRLFVDRAASTSPGFALTPANAPAILQICQRLDGIPLAIELASRRVKLLQVEEIVQRLEDRFRLLTGGSREALPRYQTLRASIDWSYDLLSEAERALLQRLSVFAGGWVLEAAEAVGCGEDIQPCDVLELLDHLVDKSLVQTVSATDGSRRFRMLETIRQYAHEKLVESGRAEGARQRHLAYYITLAEEVELKLRGPDPAPILEQLDSELNNLRLALAWSLEGKGRLGWDPEPGLRLAAALDHYWLIGAHIDEGIQWLELLLAGEVEERLIRSERDTEPIVGRTPFVARPHVARERTPKRTRNRAKALRVTAGLAQLVNEHTKAGRLLAESRQLYQSLGTDGRLGYAYTCLMCPLNNSTEEVRIYEQALVILREAGDRFGISEILKYLGVMALSCNDYQKAKTYLDECLLLRKEIGDLDGLAGALRDLGDLAYCQGDFQKAHALLKESFGLYSAIHYDYFLGWFHLWLSQLEMAEGNYAQAAVSASEALSTGRRQLDIPLTQFGLYYLSRLAITQEKYPEAAEWCQQNLAFCREKNHKAWIAYALYSLGLLAWEQGEYDRAATLHTEALVDFHESGNQLLEGFTRYHLGKVAFTQGEVAKALGYFKQALETPLMWLGNPLLFRNVDLTMLALEGIAALAADALGGGLYHSFPAEQVQVEAVTHHSSVTAGSLGVATSLLGATEAWHQAYFYIRLPRERREREACLASVRLALGEEAFAAAWAEGQAMTQEQAVAYALASMGG